MRFEHYEIFDKPYDSLTDMEKIAVGNMHKWSAFPSKNYPSAPPTIDSIQRINSILNIQIPKAFIELASIARNYGVWFGSIGDDFDSHNHILINNQNFKIAEAGCRTLPDGYVLINQGFDGCCDCFKIDEWDGAEYPIYFISLESDIEPKLRAKTFVEYWKRI